MPKRFENILPRRDSDSLKWNLYDADVTPMWIAEADVRPPQAVIDALAARVAHGVFGYTAAIGHLSAPGGSWEYPGIAEVICARLKRLYDWDVAPDALVYLPGVVPGFNVACKIAGQPGEAVLMHAPCYGPITKGPINQSRRPTYAPLRREITIDGYTHFAHDQDAFDAAVEKDTRLFLLCNPHNPTGRAFSRTELQQMADRCAQNDMLICSDEIHAELLLGDAVHVPIASLSAEVADRCITLVSPSKAFNIPGLGFAVAVIQNPTLRARYMEAMQGLVPSPQIFGYVGAMAAYQHGDEWIAAAQAFYTSNRDLVCTVLRTHAPQLLINRPEATFLNWIDCREAQLPTNPKEYFVNHAGVALADGSGFGPAGDGYLRLTFATQRAILEPALYAMIESLRPYS
jgi:cystathionine beta-lyase